MKRTRLKWLAFLFCMLFAALLIISVISLDKSFFSDTAANAQLLKKVENWEVRKIRDPKTLVWPIAQAAAGNHYDTQDIVMLIAEKNGLGKNYDLQYRNEIFVPIMAKK